MDYKLEIVRKLPVTELWNDRGKLEYKRGLPLSPAEVKAMMPNTPFVVASLGAKLVWVNPQDTPKFWKTEIKSHMKNSPDYEYLASEWIGAEGKIIVFEMTPSRY